jgi:hypothetical protein
MQSTRNPSPPGRAAGAIRRQLLLVAIPVTLVAAALLLVFSRPRSRPVIPRAPADAVQVVVKGLAEHKPQVLWDALPASYQADVRELIATFCAHMDPETYDRAFRVLDKMVNVLAEREDYFANSPVALSVPLLESSIGRNWRDDVGMLETIIHSDLSSLARLKQMDPGAFLASTGHNVIAGLEDLRVRSQRDPGLNRWEKLSRSLNESRIQFVMTSESEGVLKFTSPTNATGREVPLIQVEGRWIPADLAGSWKSRMARAREGMTHLSGPEFAKAKPMLFLVLGAFESKLDSLLHAGSQEEFDEKLRSLAEIGGMLRSLRALQNQGTR